MKLRQLLKQGKTKLETARIEEAEIESRILLEYVLDCNRTYLLLNSESDIHQDQVSDYINKIAERCSGKPIQYIIGEWEFLGLNFKLNPYTLIPRPETEGLVLLGIELLKDIKEPKVIDVGTGSGCIPISICKNISNASCIGIDYSKDALLIAKENGRLHELNDRIVWLYSDLFTTLDKNYKADLIISNPPYIESHIISTLDNKVKDYEPIMALDGGSDGLEFYRRITQDAKDYLNESGFILYEIGHDQASSVMNILEENNFKNISCKQDFYGINRFIYGNK